MSNSVLWYHTTLSITAKCAAIQVRIKSDGSKKKLITKQIQPTQKTARLICSVRCLKVISIMMVNEKIKLSCSKDCVSDKYFNLKPLSITIIVLTMILSWVGSILSLIFKVNFLIIVLGPLCVSSIFSVLCIFTYFYICKPEIKETKNILDKLFIKYRSSEPAASEDR